MISKFLFYKESFKKLLPCEHSTINGVPGLFNLKNSGRSNWVARDVELITKFPEAVESIQSIWHAAYTNATGGNHDLKACSIWSTVHEFVKLKPKIR
jgi:hypothetical protein